MIGDYGWARFRVGTVKLSNACSQLAERWEQVKYGNNAPTDLRVNLRKRFQSDSGELLAWTSIVRRRAN